MSRLSSSIDKIKPHYEVVVVGSGYGGGIAASRLARAGRQVCVLERGKEFQPGEYPNKESEAQRELQVDLPEAHVGSRTGLYDIRANDNINVVLGCGLGGTSLVNANVSLKAEPRVFDDSHWPKALRDDLETLLNDGYQRAEEMLKPTPYPDTYPSLHKLEALQKSAEYMNERFYRPPINVTFVEPPNSINHVGVEQHKCTCCGDCVSGCNFGAKNTVLMNYLPDAKNHGAEIYTQASVRFLERKDGRWAVHYQLLDSGREKFNAPTLFVTADIVILSAGTLGSTEILLRSAARGLPLSGHLGQSFSGNGDVLAFAYNTEQEINSVGLGDLAPEGREVGPCITGIIDIRQQPDVDDGMVIEEGVAPSPLHGFLPGAFAEAAKLVGKNTETELAALVREKKRELESLVMGAYKGAVHNTQTYLVMTHDDGTGRLYLDNDRLRIDWPEVGDEQIFQRVQDRLSQSVVPLGGSYVRNPLWSKVFKDNLTTVHPLGGCVMAEDAEHGVVNHKGQVFSGARGTGVYENLYVSDGSVIPVCLGVNPLLTISAVAERCCYLLAKDRGWTIDYAFGPVTSLPPPKPAAVGIQFTETMRGFFSTKVKDDYDRAFSQGKVDGTSFEFTLTITSDNLKDMLENSAHSARMVGTVNAPSLSAEPIVVTDGVFNLFVDNPEQVETRNMRYRMTMTAEGGNSYYFEGFKAIRDDSVLNIWRDTTTLFITIREGVDPGGPVLGKGILKISPGDFATQLTTVNIPGASGFAERLKGAAQFGGFFAGTLYDTYGGITKGPTLLNPDAPPRNKRDLRVTAPEIHYFKTKDAVDLRLTRYQGGGKGPVILSHGMGVSSLIFSIDTIETNLLEYLFAHGFDVWLLDYRASIELPASKTQFSADDIARYDYPAALEKVREVTGAESVQMVVHCFGSTTFFMAMLAGLQGVRSVVCSQIATHIVAPGATRLKSGLHLPSALAALGVNSLTAYASKNENWFSRLYDEALKLYPEQAEEHCNDAVCHRISFMYGLLYKHEQLNEATHAGALHEMFGIGNIKAFEHLATMVRKGQLVNFNGDDIYLPYLDRLAIPITFIHGAENACYLPESTRKTFELLCKTNGSHLYSRSVIPGYGHIDCIFGKNAAADVYPFILHHLEGIGA
jgi:cholesterol oxidase